MRRITEAEFEQISLKKYDPPMFMLRGKFAALSTEVTLIDPAVRPSKKRLSAELGFDVKLLAIKVSAPTCVRVANAIVGEAPEPPVRRKAYVQEWEESERGWGCRHDGYSVHNAHSDIASFEGQMRLEELKDKPAGYVPNEYSRPCGKPFMSEVDEKLLPETSSFGRWLPHDWKPKP